MFFNNIPLSNGLIKISIIQSRIKRSPFTERVTKRRLRDAVNSIPLSNRISKYPMIQDRIKRTSFIKMILKSQANILENTFLSRIGKIFLLKANLARFPLHVMNCFKLTKMNNEDHDKINRNFFWTQNLVCKESKEIPLVAWDEVCRHKLEGGEMKILIKQ